MKKLVITLLTLLFITTAIAQSKRDVLINKWFRDYNTCVIVCKGYPMEGLADTQRTESMKEAALTNAQFIARDLFIDSVDMVKGGTVEKYVMKDDHVIIYYVVKAPGLKAKLRKK